MTPSRPTVPKSLDDIHVESPCTQSWDAMTGDDRTRFCDECALHVHDLSAMPRAEAEAFVLGEKRAGRSLCVRFVRLEDGTVATQADEPAQRARRPALPRWRAAAVGALAFLFPLAACRTATHTMGDVRPSASAAEPAPTPPAKEPAAAAASAAPTAAPPAAPTPPAEEAPKESPPPSPPPAADPPPEPKRAVLTGRI